MLVTDTVGGPIDFFNAANSGDSRTLKTFLELGTDPNIRDGFNCGRTALHYAVLNNHKNAAATLISHGANPNAKTEDDFSTPLHYAAVNGNLDLAEFLINHGAEINDAVDSSGRTVLHSAVVSRCPKMVSLLLSRGADPSIRDFADLSSANLAHQYRAHEIAELLSRFPHSTRTNPRSTGR